MIGYYENLLCFQWLLFTCVFSSYLTSDFITIKFPCCFSSQVDHEVYLPCLMSYPLCFHWQTFACSFDILFHERQVVAICTFSLLIIGYYCLLILHCLNLVLLFCWESWLLPELTRNFIPFKIFHLDSQVCSLLESYI